MHFSIQVNNIVTAAHDNYGEYNEQIEELYGGVVDKEIFERLNYRDIGDTKQKRKKHFKDNHTFPVTIYYGSGATCVYKYNTSGSRNVDVTVKYSKLDGFRYRITSKSELP